MPWVKQEPLTFETGSVHRGRVNVALTPAAVQALTSIFEESKPSESNGMSKNDVEFYMSRFHHRLNMQKIDNIFERYGVQQPDGNQLLYLDGFLEFYQSAAQANELEVREHFHVLGYRPTVSMQARLRSNRVRIEGLCSVKSPRTGQHKQTGLHRRSQWLEPLHSPWILPNLVSHS